MRMRQSVVLAVCLSVFGSLSGCTGPGDSTILTPIASLSVGALSFSATTAGATSPAQTITLKNTGGATLNITSISITGANASNFAATNNCGSSLAASATCTVSITFTPSSAASFSASLSFADNAANSPQSVTLTGAGISAPVPLAVFNPTALSFGSQAINTAATQTITLSNPGNATLNISGFMIAGANPTDFAITANTCGSTLASLSSCAIAVTFTPLSTATLTASLSVTDNAATSIQTVALSGTGTPTPAPIVSLSPSTLTFPTTSVGTTASSQNITLSNAGNATLNITGILITGTNPADFTQTTTCGTSLAASSTCSISVTFSPASATTFTATLSVTDNAAGSPQSASLTGTGSTAPAPIATLSPTTLTLPGTAIGYTSPPRTITLSNSGNAPLNITGITIDGSNPTDFAQTNNCGTTLAAASSCTLSITFTPASANTLTATLTVADNNNPSPQTVTLTGTGILAPIGTFTGTPFTGRVLAGNLPVIGAQVQIYTAGTTGNGSAGAQRLATSLVTDSTGSFSISAPYTCPLASSILYIVATGGQTGTSGAPNSSTVLMSSPGACNTITTGASYTLNELTTVAGAYAFSQFLTTGANLGSTPTNSSGITLAAGTFANFVDPSAGTAPGPAFPSNGTAPTAELDALANLLNACTVSAGPGSSACSSLFSEAAVAGIVPTNTLDAILNIAKHPAASVAALYNLSTASKAFSPVPTAAPRDWTLFVNFTGGGMNGATAVAVDSRGRVWVASYYSAASLFSNTGAPVFASGITGNGLCDSYAAAVDQNDHVWITNADDPCGVNSVTVLSATGANVGIYTAGGVYYPFAVAIDSSNDAWIADNNHTVVILANNGTPLSGSGGYASSTLEFPTAIAVDSNRNGWLANFSSNTVTKVSPDGSTFTPYVVGSAPAGVAIDPSNNIWVTSFSGDSLALVTSTGVVASGANGYTGGGLDHPQGIAVDGAGNAWTANYRTPTNIGDSLTELSGAASTIPGTPLSPSIGYGTNAGMLEAFDLAIDASGNIWVSSFGNDTLTEFVGLAAPVKTPLLGYTHIP